MTSKQKYDLAVIVCGARDYEKRGMVYALLDGFKIYHPEMYVIQGGASGADSLAGFWADETGTPNREIRADWKGLGKAAGHIRNRAMLDHLIEVEAKYKLVVGFKNDLDQSLSKGGTENMLKISRAEEGISVYQVGEILA